MIARFALHPFRRLRLCVEIGRAVGISPQVVMRTTRTDAQVVALRRDVPYCQYHLRVLGALREIHDVHHVYGRTPSGDLPDYCISLCRDCHFRTENFLGTPLNSELIALLAQMTTTRPTP